MAVQGQGPDPSERIFTELRSKNDEVKNKAATELRDLITLLSRGKGIQDASRTDYELMACQNGPLSGSVHFTTGLPSASATSSSKHRIRTRSWAES